MNIKSDTGKGLFEADDAFIKGFCNVCRWNRTEMCPLNSDFIGRAMIDIENFNFTNCHRFCMTVEERERRWQIVMDKMHENIEIDIE